MFDTDSTLRRPLPRRWPEEGAGELLAGGEVFARRYRIEERLGGGGMADVYRALDLRLLTPVAVKILKAWFTTAEFRARLLLEARAAAAVTHPNMVRVFDVGEAEGRVYMVMEILAGPSLHGWLSQRGGRVPWQEAVQVVLPIVDALHQAHERGFVHRDVKAGNIVIDAQGGALRPVLIDFGIARAAAEVRGTDGPSLTEVGRFLGTPAYAAPEQLAGEPGMDRRIDVHALGVTLYRAIVGFTPFPEGLPRTPTTRALPIGDTVGEAPPALCRVVESALAYHADERPPTMQALGEALRAVLADSPAPRSRRRGRAWMLGAAGLAGLGALVVFVAGEPARGARAAEVVAAPNAERVSMAGEPGSVCEEEDGVPGVSAMGEGGPVGGSGAPASGSVLVAVRSGEPAETEATRSRARAASGVRGGRSPRTEVPPLLAARTEAPAVAPVVDSTPVASVRAGAGLRDAEAGVQACFRGVGVAGPMSLPLAVRLAASGAVLEVELGNPNLAAMRPCVVEVLRGLSFAPAEAPRWVRERFVLRASVG